MKIITRNDAYELGLKRYYTGRPCRRGHDGERYTSNGMCCTCLYKPSGPTVRVSYDIHREDREALDFIVNQFLEGRGMKTTPAMSEDERGYRQMIANFRKGGCSEADLAKFRTYKSFTLPEGQTP